MAAKYAFCHGWMIEPFGHTEVTCKKRESCAYFDIDFYSKHKHHLDEFEEMFPFEPCQFFFGKTGAETKSEKREDSFDIFLGKK